MSRPWRAAAFSSRSLFRRDSGKRRGSPAADAELTAFIHIGADDFVTVTVPRPDMGQGSRTALAMLIAEELDADWSRVRVQQADLDEERYGSQYAGGSNSVRAGWVPLRRAGATARRMLVEAAANDWGVEASECVTDPGRVRHPPSGRTAGYGSLAARAASLPVPRDAPLKDPADYRLIGRPTLQLDAPDIVDRLGRVRARRKASRNAPSGHRAVACVRRKAGIGRSVGRPGRAWSAARGRDTGKHFSEAP